jgi:N-acetyl sugar amidotransferase
MNTKKMCIRCVYDEDTPDISFNEAGLCGYCQTHDHLIKEYPIDERGQARLDHLIKTIKSDGKNKTYDCVIGVSGGCDSSYLLHKMKEWGLRPLAVHFDNTWNSTIATTNIEKMIKALNIDLFTIVADNKEYDDIYKSFMKAGVRDLESPTDIALAATMYIAAEKFKIKYMIEGHSFRTEGITPLGWTYMDGRYIASIQKQFGSLPLKTFPNLWLLKFLKWMIFGRIKKIRPLYFMDYNKEDAKALLSKTYGWEWYGGHHLENRFTAFFHSYFMPTRFNLDFRVVGFAALVRSGQMTKQQALEELAQPPYIEPDLVEFVKKRLGFSDETFQTMMTLPKKTYRDYPTYKKTFEKLRPFFWLMYKLDLVPKSFYMKYTAKHK